MDKKIIALSAFPTDRLTADIAAADLSAIASKWPYLLLIGLGIIVILLIVNAVYKNKK